MKTSTFWRLIIVAVLFLCIMLVVGCSSPGPTAMMPAVPGKPGALNPNVTQADIGQTICVAGWTATVRPPVSYTNPIKLALLAKLPPGSDRKAADYELDHWVPLEVGGAPRDPVNLVLQPWKGTSGAHTKDAVENRVRGEVCTHRITLAVGQQCFLTDWRHCP